MNGGFRLCLQSRQMGPGDGREFSRQTSERFAPGNRFDQSACVFRPGTIAEIVCVSRFFNLPFVHDESAIADIPDYQKITGDENHESEFPF